MSNNGVISNRALYIGQSVARNQLNNPSKSKKSVVQADARDKAYFPASFYSDLYNHGNYPENTGGILFWTDCKECGWSINISSDSETVDDNDFVDDVMVAAVDTVLVHYDNPLIKHLVAKKSYRFRIKNKDGQIFQYNDVVLAPGETKIVHIRDNSRKRAAK